jgi:UDP-N-acetylmuramoylalanine--D-glutamate ligase
LELIGERLGELDFTDKRVTVVGLGIEGVDLARYLSRRGAQVTVSDSKPRESLARRADEAAALGVRLALGANQTTDIAEADAVFVSQGVPLDLPAVEGARKRGVPLYSMTGLFMKLCPGPICGITGSSGKTTTTALVGEMFVADERPVFVGGNIGVGLLDQLSSVRPYTWSVLEVSHTQLQLVDRSPHVAAILNITPNHLDRFSWDEYRRLKANILRYQRPQDIAVLGYDDPECRAVVSQVKTRRLSWFTLGDELPNDGVYVEDGWAVLRLGTFNERLFELNALRLRGRHNQANAVAAAAIATACGISTDAIACAVETFRGVPHRLESVGEAGGAAYYNDSIATTPERSLAGIRSFEEPVILLLGGRDKNLPLEELASEAMRRCRAVILFGESAGKIDDALRNISGGEARVKRVETLPEAVDAAKSVAKPGDIVLLSPACTSYDAYESFERRGEHFRALVEGLVREEEPSLL